MCVLTAVQLPVKNQWPDNPATDICFVTDLH